MAVVKVTLPIGWGPNNNAVNGIESPDWEKILQVKFQRERVKCKKSKTYKWKKKI